MLTNEQAFELERNGVEMVVLKLSSYGGGRASALTGAFPGEVMTRGDVEDWLAGKFAERSKAEALDRSATLRWAKIAGWAAIIGVLVGIGAIALSQ